MYILMDFQGNESSMIFLFSDHWRYKLDSVSTRVRFWNKGKHFPCHITCVKVDAVRSTTTQVLTAFLSGWTSEPKP
jgi:hypothetical protein